MCGTHKKKKNLCKDLVGQPECKRPLEDLGVHGRIILRWILEKEGGTKCGLGMGQVSGFVTTVMNLRIPYEAGTFFTTWVTSQGLCSLVLSS
jgi:hypothetical protein